MALGVLLIMLVAMIIISVIGVIVMFLSGNGKGKKTAVCLMAGWAMVIAYISATSQPLNYTLAQVIRWGIGAVGIAGAVLFYKAKSEKVQLAAQILVTLSVFLGIERMFCLFG